MSAITRDLLESGAYLASFRNTPDITWWTEAQIADSLRTTLSQRPDPHAPVWLFAYGSLIWNPAFRFVEQQRATLQGWRRSFCMRLVGGRADSRNPGRMLALDACTPGTGTAASSAPVSSTSPLVDSPLAEHWPTHTTGIALRLDEHELDHELKLVWIREMIGGSYQPRWQDVLLADGRIIQAIIFTMDHNNPFFEPDATIHTVAPLIATASGPLGHNLDYLLDLDRTLRQHHIHDPYICDLIDAVRAFSADI